VVHNPKNPVSATLYMHISISSLYFSFSLNIIMYSRFWKDNSCKLSSFKETSQETPILGCESSTIPNICPIFCCNSFPLMTMLMVNAQSSSSFVWKQVNVIFFFDINSMIAPFSYCCRFSNCNVCVTSSPFRISNFPFSNKRELCKPSSSL